MTNFKFEFTHPLLLLTLIVAIGFALYSFFSSGKRYRRNRNRIVSLVLHIVIMVLCISVLAGITISFDEPNTENEVMLVVDVSDSGLEATTRRNDFVKSIIDEGGDNFKIGIVTFGYDQVYAVPLTNRASTIYDKFINADLPDTSASDVNSALAFAKERITNPQTAKIVLISDGMQTDNNALGIIKSIVMEGTKVDTAYYPSMYGNDLQVVNVTTPDYNVIAGETFKLAVDIQSSFVGSAKITLTDIHANGTTATDYYVDIVDDMQTIELDCSLALPGLHQLRLKVESDNDTISENNVYCTYMDLKVFDKILLVEKY
ncbi:MAG: VWA domain-containing protein, partial [Clostridia bacterium]|nr:VWA domain-containing protein [Clostridia bacterium]